MKRTALLVLLIIIMTSLISFCIYTETVEEHEIYSNTVPASKQSGESSRIEEITLTAVGDCLMHNTQIWSGQQPDGTYSFDTFFQEVKGLINEGDYTSICFEAPMAGPASGYTGYPAFNSPDEAALAFKDAGFDLVVTANNHIMDRGYNGAIRTMDVLHKAGLDYVGTYRSREEASRFLIKNIRGVKVGYIAYSYSTNGIPVPEEHLYFFNYIDKDKITADIKALRPEVDVLVLVLHWGVEYSPQPTHEQRIMAHDFLEAGADVILGSHPHVIQPMEIVKVKGKDKFVIYSMGNSISHQRGLERNSGIVLKMEFSKNFSSGDTELTHVSYTPTFSHSYYDQGKIKFRVVPVQQTLEKIMTGKEPYMDRSFVPILETVYADTTARLGEEYVSKP